MEIIDKSEFTDGWIEWKGGECPIPWAREGEYQIKTCRGDIGYTGVSQDWLWDELGLISIVAYRLTDGWVPVVDGKCPEVAKEWMCGEYEVKFENGELYTPAVDALATSAFRNKAVAIRRVSPAYVCREGKKVHTLSECGEEKRLTEQEFFNSCEYPSDHPANVARASEAAATIQKELEGIAQDIREIYRPLSQNEMMRIAGEAINGTRVGEVVTVERGVLIVLRKDWN